MYGKIIREQREARQLTQKDLAVIFKTTQSNIGKYEREELDLNTDTIIKFCKFFNVSADYLLGLEDDFGNKTYTTAHNDFRNNSGTINTGTINNTYHSDK